jgi:hypothetical protein
LRLAALGLKVRLAMVLAIVVMPVSNSLPN